MESAHCLALIRLWIGRGGEIRTPDPLLPKQMRYQAALRPDCSLFYDVGRSTQRLLTYEAASRSVLRSDAGSPVVHAA
jgi:hypothetical protein